MKAARILLSVAVSLSLARPLRAQEPKPKELVVLAAASLSDVLPKIADAWSAKSGIKVAFSFDATSRLAQQVKEGAPADAFFSADEDWMDFLDKNNRIDAQTRRDLLGNRLVLIVRKGSKLKVHAPADLVQPQVAHLALAGENVPAGKYAAASLEHAGVWPQVASKVVRADNVRIALQWVASGEAEAGVVYATDAKAEHKVKTAFFFDEGSHPAILYPAAVLKDSTQAAAARDFLDFCSAAKAASLFKKAGFIVLKKS